MIDNSELWKKRADEVLGKGIRDSLSESETVSFATSMLTALYGPESAQLEYFREVWTAIAKTSANPRALSHNLAVHA
jgi:hypothetical protein